MLIHKIATSFVAACIAGLLSIAIALKAIGYPTEHPDYWVVAWAIICGSWIACFGGTFTAILLLITPSNGNGRSVHGDCATKSPLP